MVSGPSAEQLIFLLSVICPCSSKMSFESPSALRFEAASFSKQTLEGSSRALLVGER